MNRNRQEKGITLIALVVTIIVLLILAGVVISLSIGNNGLFSRTKSASEVHLEKSATEKLEIALSNLQIDKKTKAEYNEERYLEEELGKEGIIVIENIAIVDGYQFEIDRSIPKIITSIGKGNESEDIKVKANGNIREDYVEATLEVEIEYEGKIGSITINGKEIEIPEKEDGKYIINEIVENNGIYTILVKDEENNYKIEKVQVKEITEDMEIWNKRDLESFRNKVNSGRTFEKRTAKVMADIDLEENENDQWKPIGNDTTQFKGTFEGNKHIINNLYIYSDEYQQVGLFYRLNKLAVVQNVVLENVQISNKYNVEEKTSYTGGIAGQASGKIINCGVNSGTIEGIKTIKNTNSLVWNNVYVGGIAGHAESESKISDSYNKANLKAENVKDVYNSIVIGGIVGGTHNSRISNCYNQGNITSNGGFQPSNGGIVGDSIKGQISNSYSVANFINTNNTAKALIGGIVGRNGITNDYPVGEITNSYCINTIAQSYYYWNGTTFEVTSTEGIVNEATLKSSANTLGEAYTNDIQNSDGTWKFNNVYPILKWQLEK